jgi:hypothetical protein
MTDDKSIPQKGTTSKERLEKGRETGRDASLKYIVSSAPRVLARVSADCPYCGSPLHTRTNRVTRIAFMGCSRYPACSFSESAENLLSEMAREIATLEAKLQEVRP